MRKVSDKDLEDQERIQSIEELNLLLPMLLLIRATFFKKIKKERRFYLPLPPPARPPNINPPTTASNAPMA